MVAVVVARLAPVGVYRRQPPPAGLLRPLTGLPLWGRCQQLAAAQQAAQPGRQQLSRQQQAADGGVVSRTASRSARVSGRRAATSEQPRGLVSSKTTAGIDAKLSVRYPASNLINT